MEKIRLGDIIKYEQPTKYIVLSENYLEDGEYPVLTAGKSLLLGRSNNFNEIYTKLPVIIFDDFTCASKFVNFPFVVKSSAMKMLQPATKSVDLKYIFYYLQKLNYMPTNHKRHWISKFASFELNLPNFKEQQKIVAELDSLSDIIEKKKEQLKELDNLSQSLFHEMFGDIERNEKGWELNTINNVCTSIVRGPFGSSLKKDFFVKPSVSTYKVYEQKNAIKKNSEIGSYYVTEGKFNELKRFECKPNDIIMSCSGTMGELYQLPNNIEKGIINQALCKFTLNNKILPVFFLKFLKNNILKLESRGSGIKNIAAVSFIKRIKIPVPPMELQNEFANRVETIDKQKDLINKSLVEVQTLFDSRMQKYFGE